MENLLTEKKEEMETKATTEKKGEVKVKKILAKGEEDRKNVRKPKEKVWVKLGEKKIDEEGVIHEEQKPSEVKKPTRKVKKVNWYEEENEMPSTSRVVELEKCYEQYKNSRSKAFVILQKMMREEIIKDIELCNFESWEKITVKDVQKMNIGNIKELSYLLYRRTNNLDILSNFVKYEQDIDFILEKMKTRLTIDSCYFCFNIFHNRNECPTLKSIKCENCGKHGHTTRKCRNRVKA